jgi:hypothetical protein
MPSSRAGLAGDYDLVALDGRPLPQQFVTASADSSTVEGGTLMLRADGSGVLVIRTRLTVGGSASTSDEMTKSDSVYLTIRSGTPELHIFSPGMHRDMPVYLGARPLTVTEGQVEFLHTLSASPTLKDRRLAFARRVSR